MSSIPSTEPSIYMEDTILQQPSMSGKQGLRNYTMLKMIAATLRRLPEKDRRSVPLGMFRMFVGKLYEHDWSAQEIEEGIDALVADNIILAKRKYPHDARLNPKYVVISNVSPDAPAVP